MGQNLSLWGDVEPRAVREALFLAFMPDASEADRFLDFGRRTALRVGFTGSLMNRIRLHVSLHPLMPLGASWDELLARVDRAVNATRMGPFRIPLDGVATFNGRGGGKSLVLTCSSEQVTAYYQRLGAALAWERLHHGAANFSPHLTLIRGVGFVEEGPVADMGWVARDVVLIRSFQGQGRYEILERWPLRS